MSNVVVPPWVAKAVVVMSNRGEGGGGTWMASFDGSKARVGDSK